MKETAVVALQETAKVYEEVIDKVAYTFVGLFAILTTTIWLVVSNRESIQATLSPNVLSELNISFPVVLSISLVITASALIVGILIEIADNTINNTISETQSKINVLIFSLLDKLVTKNILKEDVLEKWVNWSGSIGSEVTFLPNILFPKYGDKYLSKDLRKQFINSVIKDYKLEGNYSETDNLYNGWKEILAIAGCSLKRKEHNYRFITIILKGISTIMLFYGTFFITLRMLPLGLACFFVWHLVRLRYISKICLYDLDIVFQYISKNNKIKK